MKVCDNVLEMIDSGKLSDPEGVRLCHPKGVGKDGMPRWRCVRGTSDMEGTHHHMEGLFEGSNVSPRLGIVAMRDFCHRHTLEAEQRAGLVPKFGHFLTWMEVMIQRITIEMHGEPEHKGWELPENLPIEQENNLFIQAPEHRLCNIDEVAQRLGSGAFKLTRNEEFLAKEMSLLVPPLPVRTAAEKKLFFQLLTWVGGTGSTPNWNAILNEWCECVGDDGIFPKLKSHLTLCHSAWTRSRDRNATLRAHGVPLQRSLLSSAKCEDNLALSGDEEDEEFASVCDVHEPVTEKRDGLWSEMLDPFSDKIKTLDDFIIAEDHDAIPLKIRSVCSSCGVELVDPVCGSCNMDSHDSKVHDVSDDRPLQCQVAPSSTMETKLDERAEALVVPVVVSNKSRKSTKRKNSIPNLPRCRTCGCHFCGGLANGKFRKKKHKTRAVVLRTVNVKCDASEREKESWRQDPNSKRRASRRLLQPCTRCGELCYRKSKVNHDPDPNHLKHVVSLCLHLCFHVNTNS